MLANKTRIARRGRPRAQAGSNVRKHPVQARSRETVAVILEAAARVLEKDGLAGYNTNAVAERAGVSVGSLYQYFPNKDALTVALIGMFEQELLHAVRGAAVDARGEDLRSSLRSIIRELLRVHRSRAALNRLLELEEDRLRRSISDHAGATALRQAIASLLKKHRACLSVPVSVATIQDIITITRAMADVALLNDTPPASAERRILHAVNGYLLWNAQEAREFGAA